MSTLELILLMLLVVDAIALAALVLLQQGRGAEVGAAFGSGASNTMFGSSGSASFLTTLTVWLAIGFFLISFGLAWTAKERAAKAGSLGVPQIEAPLSVDDAGGALESVSDATETTEDVAGTTAEDAAEATAEEAVEDIERLTDESESVDSDIPDV